MTNTATMFTKAEIAYLKSQPLARIATVANDGQPDVAPVSFEFDGTHFNISGRNPTVTLKHKNVAAGNTQVALAIDDLASVNPWQARGIKIHGTAEIVERPGANPYLRITPVKSWSWGIEGAAIADGKFAVQRSYR